MNNENKLFEALNDIGLCLSRLKFINNISEMYVINSEDSESKLDMGDAVNNFSDCIEMYVARLEVAIAQAWKEYFAKQNGGSKPRDESTTKQPRRDTSDIMLGGHHEEECFALEVTDYGFYPHILPGDSVIVHSQSDVNDGEVAVVMIDGNTNAILRRIKHNEGGGMILTVDNPTCGTDQNKRYEPIVIGCDELNRVQVLGKVISLMRDMNSEAVKRDWENARAADDVNE